MKSTATLLCLALYFSAQGKSDYELGEVSTSELKESSCALDQDAHAYYHFDIGSTELDYDNQGLKTKQDRRLKLKVIDAQGVEAGDFVIHLRNSAEIENIKGYTYNLINGEVEGFKLEKDNIHESRIHDGLRKVSINMPRVQAGSIIELEYKITNRFLGELPKWVFQKSYPVQHSEYTVHEHVDFNYRRNFRGYLPVAQSERERSARYFGRGRADVFSTVYSLDSIPAFESEKFLSSPSNFLSAVEFSLVSTTFTGFNVKNYGHSWSDIDQLYKQYKYFGEFLDQGRSGSRILQVIGLEGQTPEDRISELFKYLQFRLSWNEYHTDFAERSATEIFDEKNGTSGELNLLLTLLLQQDGFDAEPMLVSTRSNGFVFEAMPDDRYFNHVIAKVKTEKKTFYLDLTGDQLGVGQVPFKNLNGPARLPYSSVFESIEPSGKFSIQKLYDLRPGEEGISGQLRYTAKNYAAIDHQDKFKALDDESSLNHLRQSFPDLQLNSYKSSDNNSLNSSYEVSFSDQVNLQQIGDELFVKPFPMENEENPLTAETRKYPLDFGYATEYQSMSTVHIPEGYEVSQLPEPAVVDFADNRGKLMYQARQLGDMIQVNYMFQINSVWFEVEQYPYLQQFYGLAAEKLQESIVLKKKS